MLADSVCLQTGLLLAVCVEWGCGGWKLCAFSPLRISPPPILLLGHLHLAICGDHSTHTTVAPPPPSHSQKQCFWFIHTLTTTHMSLCVLLGSFFFFCISFIRSSLSDSQIHLLLAWLKEKAAIMSISKNGVKRERCYRGNHSPCTPPSSHRLSPPIHLCAGDARVSSLSTRFVLTSPGHAPLTLPAEDTRGGGGGGRGDEEKQLPLLSHHSITLKRAEQQPKKKEDTQDLLSYLQKKKIIIITPTLPHSPFQGGHFSSLSPPFLFYPDFFLWDPGFVFATSKPLNFSGISGEVRVCSVWCFSRLFSLPIMAHAASQLKKNRGEVDVNAIEDEKEKRRKSRRASSREQKRKVTGEGWPPGWAGWLLVASSVLLSLCRWSVVACTYVCVRGVCACVCSLSSIGEVWRTHMCLFMDMFL